jgi:hypothetical protein
MGGTERYIQTDEANQIFCPRHRREADNELTSVPVTANRKAAAFDGRSAPVHDLIRQTLKRHAGFSLEH